MLAARYSLTRGLDGTIAIGVPLLILGSLTMLAGVAVGPHSAVMIVAPVMLFLAGVGLILPQGLAAAMAPFPDRAGAASSCLGVTQMTFSALVGAGIGLTLGGGSALPLPLVMSGVALAAALVFLALRRMQASKA